MKLVIAFALLSVAFAAEQVQVVHLPEARAPAIEQIDIRPLIVPQSVLDALKALPVNVNIDDALRVNFVDAPIEMEEAKAEVPEQNVIVVYSSDVFDVVEPLAADEETLKVNFVDAPIELEEAKAQVPEQEENVVYSSDVSDVVEPFAADEESLKVRFVDAPIELEEAKAEVPAQDVIVVYTSDVSEVVEPFAADEESFKVRFVDAPVQAEAFEAVRIAEPVFKSAVPVEAVKVVDAPRLGKLFADPRLR